MTFEEALAWCIEQNAQVDFTDHDGLKWVRVYHWRESKQVLGAGRTFVEAVEAAHYFVMPKVTP